MSLFFKEICVYGLQKISKTKKELTYREIKDLLTFEDVDEVRKFLIWYGITKDKTRRIVNEADKVPIALNNPNKNFVYEKAFQKTNKRLVENKKGDKLRKDEVNAKINFIKNENDQIDSIDSINSIKSNDKQDIIKEKEKELNPKLINKSLINSDISNNKSASNIKEKASFNQPISNGNTIMLNTEIKNQKNLENSFLSQGTYNKLFPPTKENKQNLTPKMTEKKNINDINNSEKKIKNSDIFIKPYSPKRTSFDSPNNLTMNDNINNKSIDFLSHTSISSIEPQKNSPNFTNQTLEFFCEVANSAINKLISDHKLDFIYRLKFISEKYKIKLDLIENYINRRKFFVFNEFKKCCLDKKFSREYINELVNYKSNLNSINTNENSAFKIENKNISLNKNFEFLTFDDIIYFIINNFQNEHKNNMIEYKDNINHLQINIYTTKDLIKSTKLLSCLKLKKNIIEENEDGTEMTLNNSNMNMTLNSINIKISFIIKFIFVDQIIDLESYIYENQSNIPKYSILIPFFDIIKSDPENQQILTKFFTILDLGLGSFIKKDIIFFFIKRDIEQNSDLYKEYRNIQNDFIYNLTQKYSNKTNDIINIDENYENNDEIKKRIIYLSPIDEFGKCYQNYIKYNNNKTFVELFENNKLMKLNSYNQNEVLIPFEKHITELDIIINHYISLIEEDLKNYLDKNNNINYFFNKKLWIEILIGFVLCKILLIYYQNKCLIFANELYKIPSYHSNDELLILENNLINTGTILRQINLDGYDYVWDKCLKLDKNKVKDIFSFFDIYSQMICSYNLISENDIQNYEYTFRKQYYDVNIEKKDYEVAKNFVNYFNKIISKFFQNNNIKIKFDDTTQIIEKIYIKNKTFLISTIAKILTNNDNLIFNENLIYVKGLEKFYLNLKDKEIAELHNNLNKKRKRITKTISSMNNLSNKKNVLKINKHSKLKENNNQILNNIININESIDKSKDIGKASFFKENGDLSNDYIQYFRNVKKINLPDGLI